MKIDIHVHTKKTKQGDAISRNVDAEKFIKTISHTDVGIVAITNHNVETIFLLTSSGKAYISSSIVRDVMRNGGKYEKLVPDPVRI